MSYLAVGTRGENGIVVVLVVKLDTRLSNPNVLVLEVELGIHIGQNHLVGGENFLRSTSTK